MPDIAGKLRWLKPGPQVKCFGDAAWFLWLCRLLAPGGSFVISLGAVVSERDNPQDLIFDL